MRRWFNALTSALALGCLTPLIVTVVTLAGVQDAPPIKQLFFDVPELVSQGLFRIEHPGSAAWMAASFVEFLVPFAIVVLCWPQRRGPATASERRAYDEALTQFHAQDYE